jgi:hypothetical protein
LPYSPPAGAGLPPRAQPDTPLRNEDQLYLTTVDNYRFNPLPRVRAWTESLINRLVDEGHLAKSVAERYSPAEGAFPVGDFEAVARAINLLKQLDAGEDRLYPIRSADLARPAVIEGVPVDCQASIGLAYATERGQSDALLQEADTALYAAKARGKGRWRQYRDDMPTRARQLIDVRRRLEEAIDSDALRLHYQPIVELASGRAVGFEALIQVVGDQMDGHFAVGFGFEFVTLGEKLGGIAGRRWRDLGRDDKTAAFQFFLKCRHGGLSFPFGRYRP